MQLFENVDLKSKMKKEDKILFANKLKEISKTIGFKISARGWAYQLEVEGLITKAEFDRIESIINLCRDKGYLPIDFVAEEEGRRFSGVEKPEDHTPIEDMEIWVRGALEAEEHYTPDWWDGEKYYIQMVVEKIDLKTLFEPICKKYHVAIATSKGWGSKLQRATYSQRYAKAEEKGLQSVLLYYGDHDLDGLRISNFLRSNLEDLKNIVWSDGTKGYDPQNLIIERFGLDADFIKEHELSWIENLITGSGKNLASPQHKNFHMEYVQNYIKTFGIRKCEANALVTIPSIAREFVEGTIIKYLGKDAKNRFYERWYKIKKEFDDFREDTGLDESLKDALKTIEDSLKDEGDDI